MSTADLIPALKPWFGSGVDNERKRKLQIDKGITAYNMMKSDYGAKIPKGGEVTDNVIYYAEEYDFDTKITGQLATATITFSGYIMGHQAMSTELMRLHVQPGTMLMRPSDGLQVMIQEVDYNALTATVAAHGNTGTLSDDAGPIQWNILSYATTEDNETHVPLAVDFSWVKCGTQITSALFKWGPTWEKQAMRGELNIVNKVRRQINYIIRRLRNETLRAVLLGTPVFDGGVYKHGDETERSTMTGIFTAVKIAHETDGNPETRKDAGLEVITETILNSVLFHMVQDEGVVFDEGDWYLVCDPTTRQWISRFGQHAVVREPSDTSSGGYITSFISNTGKKFPIVQENFLPAGKLYIHNLQDSEWGYYSGYDLIERDLAVESLMNRRLHALQAYAKQKRRRWIGEIYNLRKTYP